MKKNTKGGSCCCSVPPRKGTRIDKFTWYIAVLGRSRQTAQHRMPPRRASNFSIILVSGLSIFFRLVSGSSSSECSDGRVAFGDPPTGCCCWLLAPLLLLLLPRLRFSSWLLVMICSDKFSPPCAGWVATEINNVEGCPPEVDDEDEDATTEAVEEEGMDEGPGDELGCKSADIRPPKFIK